MAVTEVRGHGDARGTGTQLRPTEGEGGEGRPHVLHAHLAPRPDVVLGEGGGDDRLEVGALALPLLVVPHVFHHVADEGDVRGVHRLVAVGKDALRGNDGSGAVAWRWHGGGVAVTIRS